MSATLRLRTKTNPVFFADRLETLLADEPARLQRILVEPRSVDLLTWNVFASLGTHRDPEWLAYRLECLLGPARPPVRVALWTGRHREPLLPPNRGYLEVARRRAQQVGGDERAIAGLAEPVEVPVRIATPDVVGLVDTTLDALPSGTGGRDRVVELVDVGLDHARRLSTTLAVAVVYPSGTAIGRELSARLQRLRRPESLAAALPHRAAVPQVVLRELAWQQLLTLWESEAGYLDLGGQPVKPFLDHVRRLGLR
jgi:hypothetical protein